MTTAVDLLAYDPNKVKPGWIAFFVVLALVVATFLLWRSMNTQLGKIRVPPRAAFGPDGAEQARTSGTADDPPSSPPKSPPESPPAEPPPSAPSGNEEHR